jgi:hypothetical protein
MKVAKLEESSKIKGWGRFAQTRLAPEVEQMGLAGAPTRLYRARPNLSVALTRTLHSGELGLLECAYTNVDGFDPIHRNKETKRLAFYS